MMDAIIRKSRIIGGDTMSLAPSFVPTDSATTAWVTAVGNNGGTVSPGRQTLVNALILSLKGNGIFTKLDRLWLHAGENQPSALTDIIATGLATAVNSPTFTTDRGFNGDGVSGKYLDSNYNPATNGVAYTLNTCHSGSWIETLNTSADFAPPLGSSVTSPSQRTIIIDYRLTNVMQFAQNDVGFSASQSASTGHYLGNRSGASSTECYLNGGNQNTGTDAVGASIGSQNIFILGRNLNGAIDLISQHRIAATHFGGSLTSTDVSNLYNALRTYMTGVGVA